MCHFLLGWRGIVGMAFVTLIGWRELRDELPLSQRLPCRVGLWRRMNKLNFQAVRIGSPRGLACEFGPGLCIDVFCGFSGVPVKEGRLVTYARYERLC
ncbi:hypothetical protein CSUI_002144 [Cystoisospora suis]|uniref:Uncharacterized protein n=1 Tax=Cystoisospora suis TaxID=483139 RepID=A0A2C6LAB5_9APIC|nr:hypothetical protein CSUI_002144 [Cystoisospora suis]